MIRYDVITDDEAFIVEAEYFKMIYDGISRVDAHFYVTEADTSYPPVTHEVLVGYVKAPVLVRKASDLDTDDSGA